MPFSTVAPVNRSGITELVACARIAEGQHGLITRSQALASGISSGMIQRLVRAKSWIRIRPNVYALWQPRAAAQWQQRLAAAALWLGEQAAASGRAASVHWGLDGVDAAPLEFLTTGRHRATTPDLVLHHVRSLPAEDAVVRNGIRVTTVPRTLVDLATLVGPHSLELALESARRKGLTTVEEVRAAVEKTRRSQRGRGVLRELLDQLPEQAAGSPLEVVAWQLFRSAGLPLPVRQHEIRTDDGRFVARVDFAYPEAMLAIEVDGFDFHSTKPQLVRDRRRQNAILALGWIVYRITSDDLRHRAPAVVAEIAALRNSRLQLET